MFGNARNQVRQLHTYSKAQLYESSMIFSFVRTQDYYYYYYYFECTALRIKIIDDLMSRARSKRPRLKARASTGQLRSTTFPTDIHRSLFPYHHLDLSSIQHGGSITAFVLQQLLLVSRLPQRARGSLRQARTG